MSDIRVARLKDTDSPLEVTSTPQPSLGPKDVLVKVHACSVVPNTYNLVHGKQQGPVHLAMAPLSFGLDVSGTIEEVGKHVENLKKGDPVYVDPWLTCGTCQQCRRGDETLCSAGALRGYFGFGDAGARTLERYPIGGLSDYVVSPDTNVCVLKENVSLDVAARFGYIGTSFAALKNGGVGPGSSVLINGVTGTLGYAAVSCALGLGAVKILGVGRSKEKLEHIESLFPAQRVSVVSSEDTDVAEWIDEQTAGQGVDALIDCLGVGGDAKATETFVGKIKRGGHAILVAGGAEGNINQPYLETMMRSVAVIGSTWFKTGQIDELVDLVSAGVIDFSYLETKEFSLDQVNEALDCVGGRLGGAVNVLVKPSLKG